MSRIDNYAQLLQSDGEYGTRLLRYTNGVYAISDVSIDEEDMVYEIDEITFADNSIFNLLKDVEKLIEICDTEPLDVTEEYNEIIMTNEDCIYKVYREPAYDSELSDILEFSVRMYINDGDDETTYRHILPDGNSPQEIKDKLLKIKKAIEDYIDNRIKTRIYGLYYSTNYGFMICFGITLLLVDMIDF